MTDSTAGSCFTGFGDGFPGIHRDYRKEHPVGYCRNHDGAEAGEPELEALADAPVRGAVAVELEHPGDDPGPKSIRPRTVARQVVLCVADADHPEQIWWELLLLLLLVLTTGVLPAGTGAGGRESLRRAAPRGDGGEREREREEALSILEGSSPLRGWWRGPGLAAGGSPAVEADLIRGRRRRDETPSRICSDRSPPRQVQRRFRSPPLRWSLAAAAAADWSDVFETGNDHLPPARAHHNIAVRVEAADR